MRARTTANYIVIALAAVLTAAVVLLPSVSSEAVYPIENARRTLIGRIGARIAGCFRGAAAAAENAKLKREVAALAILRGDVERLEAENARLRSALSYSSARRGEWLAAAVLSRGGSAAAVRDVIRVDKGLLDGVVRNSAVAVPEGLVGVVTAVSPHAAEVTLVTDPSVKVDCEVELPCGRPARGILSGSREDLLTLRYFRSAAEVPPRSRVLTSGRGGVFPRGIEIGTFNGIRTDADGLSDEGEVLPGVDYQTLEDVFIRREK